MTEKFSFHSFSGGGYLVIAAWAAVDGHWIYGIVCLMVAGLNVFGGTEPPECSSDNEERVR